MRTVIISPRARRQFTAAVKWWLRNRDKAPDAFSEDFAAAAAAIAENAAAAPIVRTRRRNVRRLLMQRVRYYVYYHVAADGKIEILAIWHASRRPPHL